MNVFNQTDKIGQDKAVHCINRVFSASTLNIEQHYQDSNPVDIYVTATTRNGNERYYSFECKDRQMNHTKYADSGYLIEQRKIDSLLKESERGYTPIYLNTFNDGYCICWDLSKINFNECDELDKPLPKTTVADTTKSKKNNRLLKNNQAVFIGKYDK